MTKWLNHHNRWTEANQYTPAEFAWLCLQDPSVCSEPRSSCGHRLWLPLGNMTNEAIAQVVEAAEPTGMRLSTCAPGWPGRWWSLIRPRNFRRC